MATSRITRDEMLLRIAATVAERSTCPRADVGALITNSGRILSMGYNGAPPHQPHCVEVGCETIDGRPMRKIGEMWIVEDSTVPADMIVELPQDIIDAGCHRTVHAEANAIAFAAQDGIEIGGSSMYCTHAPCYTCAKLMLSAGIRVAHYVKPYRDTRGVELLQESGVIVVYDA